MLSERSPADFPYSSILRSRSGSISGSPQNENQHSVRGDVAATINASGTIEPVEVVAYRASDGAVLWRKRDWQVAGWPALVLDGDVVLVASGFAAGEIQIGTAAMLDRDQRVGPPAIPAAFEGHREPFKPAPRHFRHQRVAIAEMAVGGGGGDTGGACHFNKSKPRWAAFAGQPQGGIDQRFTQIAVMITLPPRPLAWMFEAHVKSIYTTRRWRTTSVVQRASCQLAASTKPWRR